MGGLSRKDWLPDGRENRVCVARADEPDPGGTAMRLLNALIQIMTRARTGGLEIDALW